MRQDTRQDTRQDMRQDMSQDIPKRIIILNIILSQAILLGAALLIKFFFLGKNTEITGLFPIVVNLCNLLIFLITSAILISLQILFHKYFDRDTLSDELNLILMSTLSLPYLFVVFLSGAFIEELLFRGIIQQFSGIWLTSLLFALIHTRYITKPVVFLEVYVMGVILGFCYQMTSALWVPVLCHFSVNFGTAFLLKRGFLKY